MAITNVNQVVFNNVQCSRLSVDQSKKIHNASLELLEGVGARLHSQEAIDLLEKGGADVSDGNLVRIPAGMVEKAFTTVPKRVVMYDRNGNPAMRLEGRKSYYGPGSDCLNIIDHRTGQRRAPVLKDVEEGVRLCDSLENIDFVMSMVLPTDVDQLVADRHQMEVMLNNTTKPIIIVTYEYGGLVDAVEMAEAVVGGPDELRRKPLVTCYVNVISGLFHGEESLKKLLYLSGKGLPACYIPCTTAGVNSPITPAGAVTLDNAGVLLGLVLSQLNRPGAPYIMSVMQPTSMDMKTMVTPYVDPERGIWQSLADLYQLPSFGIGGCSDSKVVDQQAAAEAALSLMSETLVGGNLIHDMGYLETGLAYSFAQLVICDEIAGWTRTFCTGVDISDEALAVDLIAKQGPRGEYLATEHTTARFRKLYYPKVFERGNFAAWESKGSKTLAERAGERVDVLLAKHSIEPLPEDVRVKIREIKENAKPEAKK